MSTSYDPHILFLQTRKRNARKRGVPGARLRRLRLRNAHQYGYVNVFYDNSSAAHVTDRVLRRPAPVSPRSGTPAPVGSTGGELSPPERCY